MPSYLKIKKPPDSVLLAFGIFALLLIILSTAWGFRHWPPSQAEIESELNGIVPPAGATKTQHVVVNKWSHGSISNYYRVDLTYAQIRTHYDAELARHGWKFKEQIPLTSWGKNLGASSTVYCRGNHAIDIYFTGDALNEIGYRYALGISWGHGDCS